MIPDFDHNNVLPPHLGTPTDRSQLSPYQSDTLEFCKKFATSRERVEILKGYVAFRMDLQSVGVTNGFQWLDGSFTENIEKRESRPPKDLDLVTFYKNLPDDTAQYIVENFQAFMDPSISKTNYNLDHYPVDYAYSPDSVVANTQYWLQLFSHNRLGVWKGIVRVELNTPEIDNEAKIFLESLKL